MCSIRILYDGWPLVRTPNSPAALHLYDILAHLPRSVEAVIAFPEDPPVWTSAEVVVHVSLEDNSVAGRLRWEQRTLSRLLDVLKCDLLHLTGSSAPLFGGRRSIVSLTGFKGDAAPQTGFRARLREALSQGGVTGAQGVLWPQDLVPHPKGTAVSVLPPLVHPSYEPKDFFRAPAVGFDLPDSYVLYHGPQDEASLHRALAGWTWPAGSMGDVYQLLMLGMSPTGAQIVARLAEKLKIAHIVTVAPLVAPDKLAGVYQFADALFHPAGVSPWGGPVRRALACGKPVVALETPMMGALVGPAAFLAPLDKPRDLGAGLITVLVREDLPKQLRDAALARTKNWRTGAYGHDLEKVYLASR